MVAMPLCFPDHPWLWWGRVLQVYLNSELWSHYYARPLTMQVYRLLFGPLPELDGKLGFLRKQEPWSHLGSNPLLQMEVRGLTLREG